MNYPWEKQKSINPEVKEDTHTAVRLLQMTDKKLHEIEQYVASELLGLAETVWENHEVQDGYEHGKQEILEAIQRILTGI